MRRELSEELGVDAEAGEVLAESVYHYDHGSFLLIGMYASISTNNLTLTVHDRADWVVNWLNVVHKEYVSYVPAQLPSIGRMAPLILRPTMLSGFRKAGMTPLTTL
jgi:8-oxo-dGTP pyrophosphatase MutT (NUDIX family)